MITTDRLSGEVLPDTEDFLYQEMGAFTPDGFRRNSVIAETGDAVAHWRTKFANTGIFRTWLRSNCPDLKLWDDPETLFYGDLCFDFDITKDLSNDAWQAMIREVHGKALPQLRNDFGLTNKEIRCWFSGGRGLHIEVPASALAVWPHHDLHRIYGFYALQLQQQLDLQYLDLSLYGFRHLYRMEHSIHQRSGLYKIPFQAQDLEVLTDLTWLTERLATRPRHVLPFPVEATTKGSHFYATIVQGALSLTRERPEAGAIIGERSRYDRSFTTCVETMTSDDYLLPEGNRNVATFFLASHLRHNGFEISEAEQELQRFANNNCDPPYTKPDEIAQLDLIVANAYHSTKSVGCSYVKRKLPFLCKEDQCPLGQQLIRNRKSQT